MDNIAGAHLAALAIEHGLELNSTDDDFARFIGLYNPIASSEGKPTDGRAGVP